MARSCEDDTYASSHSAGDHAIRRTHNWTRVTGGTVPRRFRVVHPLSHRPSERANDSQVQAALAEELAVLPPACQPNDPATPSGCSAVRTLIADYKHLRDRLRAE